MMKRCGPKLLQEQLSEVALCFTSMPDSIVIPVIGYHDVDEAVDWLCSAFKFEVRLRIASHRAQLCTGVERLLSRRWRPGMECPREPAQSWYASKTQTITTFMHYVTVHRSSASQLIIPTESANIPVAILAAIIGRSRNR